MRNDLLNIAQPLFVTGLSMILQLIPCLCDLVFASSIRVQIESVVTKSQCQQQVAGALNGMRPKN